MSPPPPPHAPWPRVKLGEVCEVRAGADYKAVQDAEGKYPIYGTGGEMGRAKDYRCPAGTVIVGRKGTLDNPLLVKEPFWNIDTCFGVIPCEKVVPEYLHFFCKNFDFYSLVPACGRPSTNSSAIKAIDFPLPPLPEQRAIVAKLERELAAVDAIEKKFEEMEKTAETGFKAELKEAFEDLTQRSRGAENGRGRSPSAPDGRAGTPCPPHESHAPCPRVKLGSVCENLDYKRVPITKSDRKAGEYPYYGASGIVDYVADYIFDGDYLLVSEDGANLEARTTPIAFSVSGKIWVNNHAHILRFPEKSNQHFVEYFIAATDISGLITGAAQPKLTQKALNEIELPYPPLPTQRAIVARLDAARVRKEKLVAAARKGAETAALLRKALLKEAFE